MDRFIKKYFVLIILVVVSLIIMGSGIYFYYHNLYKVNKDFSQIDLSDVDNLMIVAHPDDELLWGGGHLIEDNYLVVCITCGSSKIRVNEFTKVMNKTNDEYIMLGYPDKTNGERDNWNTVRDDIAKDLKDIIALKDWNMIVTHNPDGEYGHIHHKMTSKITTDVTTDKNKLYYFGHYYSKSNLINNINDMVPLNDDILKQKKNLIGLYKSQSFIQTYFDQMNPYEEWINYNDWGKSSFRSPQDFSKIDLKNINKLMIVAHPDDEIVFGSNNLLKDDYLVVCITCGVDKTRVKEFESVMKKTNDKYIMLGYPNKTNGEDNNWNSFRGNITEDIKDIIALKDWELIVTHNPEGEYGHLQHQMTSSIVSYVTSNKDKLYYFGRYYSEEDLAKEELTPLKNSALKSKQNLLKLYKSANLSKSKYKHIFPYENWITYQKWGEDNEETN